MTEQWQELKETIIEMRDNNGTGTQQETCKFLSNLMDILEKQIQESSDDCISRQAVLSKIKEVCFSEEWVQFRVDYGSNGQRDFLINYIEQLPSVNQEPKTGHMIVDEDGNTQCSECDGKYKDCTECILDKIKAEIEEIHLIGYAIVDGKMEIAIRAVMQIIDKYKTESEYI